MNAEIFARWLRRQGHHVVRTPSSYWFDAGPRVFQAFPYHWIIQPSQKELRELMRRQGTVALRYSTPFAAPDGMVSYHVVMSGPYNMETLSRQARKNVRHGLSQCKVESISFERLAEEGWVLQQDTLERQGRTGSMTQSEWQRICRAAKGLPGFEAWGAIVKGELAASLLTVRIDDTGCYLFTQSHHKFLNTHVNNFLFYSVSHEMLSREGLAEIFCSLHSLDAPQSVDEFKFRMGFSAKPLRQRVVFHPWLQPFANNLAHSFTARLLRRYPGNYVLAKTEGMLRFHLQGKRPLNEQDWPECLVNRKNELFEASNFREESMGYGK